MQAASCHCLGGCEHAVSGEVSGTLPGRCTLWSVSRSQREMAANTAAGVTPAVTLSACHCNGHACHSSSLPAYTGHCGDHCGDHCDDLTKGTVSGGRESRDAMTEERRDSADKWTLSSEDGEGDATSQTVGERDSDTPQGRGSDGRGTPLDTRCRQDAVDGLSEAGLRQDLVDGLSQPERQDSVDGVSLPLRQDSLSSLSESGLSRQDSTDSVSDLGDICDCDACLLGFDDTQPDGVAKQPIRKLKAVMPLIMPNSVSLISL